MQRKGTQQSGPEFVVDMRRRRSPVSWLRGAAARTAWNGERIRQPGREEAREWCCKSLGMRRLRYDARGKANSRPSQRHLDGHEVGGRAKKNKSGVCVCVCRASRCLYAEDLSHLSTRAFYFFFFCPFLVCKRRREGAHLECDAQRRGPWRACNQQQRSSRSSKQQGYVRGALRCPGQTQTA